MKPRISWAQPHPPNGRIIARIGNIEIGAIFPVHQGGYDWRRFHLGSSQPKSGYAKSELAAKNALAGSIRDWLSAAGLDSAGIEAAS